MEVDISDLDAQIALLQAAKEKKLAIAARDRERKEREDAKVLVGVTPTKVKARPLEAKLPEPPRQPIFASSSKTASSSRTVSRLKQDLPSIPNTPALSSMSSSLAALRRSAPSSASASRQAPIPRSGSFSSRPQPVPKAALRARSVDIDDGPSGKGKEKAVQRDEDSLTIIENLMPGPKEFGRDPEGEEVWEFVEPNSGIRLSERRIPHSTLQDHLSGRYYLPPSLLYSVIRLSRDGATYDIPVEGDWITIAVVAERGDIRVSGTKGVATGPDSDSEFEDEGGKSKQGDKRSVKQKEVDKWKKRRGPKKYLNLKLCSLPPCKVGGDSGGGGPAGDALLQLLLFEADSIVRGEKDDDGKEKIGYRGGSGGAYEKWCNLGVGDVVAILNPRVLRPLRSGESAPHPLTLPLALNPTSGDSIMLIGHARDLGCCTAIQKDGNRCKSWVDTRQGQVCEYHVHTAVQRGRASRAEFTASTSSFALSSRPNDTSTTKNSYDPKRKTGLLPSGGPKSAPRGSENGGGGATYVVGGGVVSTTRLRDDGGLKSFGDEHLAEKLGRSSKSGKMKRKMEEREVEAALSKLLERDGKNGSTGAKYLTAVGKERDKEKGKKVKVVGTGKNGKGKEGEEEERKRPFSAGAIKRIGFDPSARAGVHDGEDLKKRLDSIANLRDGDRPVRLGKQKGWSRSNVIAPPGLAVPSSVGEAVAETAEDGGQGEQAGMVDLD